MTTGDISSRILNLVRDQSIDRADLVSAHISAVVASDLATWKFVRALAQGKPVDPYLQFAARVRWYVEQLGNIFTFLKSFVETAQDPGIKGLAFILLKSSLSMLPETRFPGDNSLAGYWPYAWSVYEMLRVSVLNRGAIDPALARGPS